MTSVNIIERNQAIARERLREEFGTDAERFINNQSAIDFEALREFLEQQRVNVERLQTRTRSCLINRYRN